jgi:hypothetical protein
MDLGPKLIKIVELERRIKSRPILKFKLQWTNQQKFVISEIWINHEYWKLHNTNKLRIKSSIKKHKIIQRSYYFWVSCFFNVSNEHNRDYDGESLLLLKTWFQCCFVLLDSSYISLILIFLFLILYLFLKLLSQ